MVVNGVMIEGEEGKGGRKSPGIVGGFGVMEHGKIRQGEGSYDLGITGPFFPGYPLPLL